MPQPYAREQPPFDAAADEIVHGFMTAHEAGEVDRAVDDYVAEDAVYTLFVDRTDAPVGGRAEGREAIRAALKRYHEIFEYIVFRGHTLSAHHGIVRQRLETILRHRASNERWSATGRLNWTVRDGLVVACDEYQDEAKLLTFFRLFGGGPTN